ncbi:MAG: hypothetical protein A2Y10_19815 [Planctomycetes bacterium GWF2_41_51]|nr:MAG: hypothetical protein A2Y10_19815 [Planctomycetes bacterium GWF2_41_51]HBG28532.1 hypothetical protein [Phycisphaerales bacterium]
MGWTTFFTSLRRPGLANLAENNSNNNHQITSKLGDTADMFYNYRFCCPEVELLFCARSLHAIDAIPCNGVQSGAINAK